MPVQETLHYSPVDSINMDELELLAADDGGFYQFGKRDLLKFDAAGALVWGKRIDVSPAAIFSNCTLTTDGSVLMAFATAPEEFTGVFEDSVRVTNFIALFNSVGGLQWSQRFSQTIHGDISIDYDEANSPPGISMAPDGKVFLCQDADPYPIFGGYSYIVKWDPAHPELGADWGATDGLVQSVFALPDGGCMVAGAQPLGDPTPSIQVSRLDNSGTQQWSAGVLYDPNGYMLFDQFILCANGDVATGGAFVGSGPLADHFAARYGANGSLKWFALYDVQLEPSGCWWGSYGNLSEMPNGDLLFGSPLNCFLCDGSYAMFRTDSTGNVLDAYRTDTIIALDSLHYPHVTSMGVKANRIFTHGTIQAKEVGGFFFGNPVPFASSFDWQDTSGCLLKPLTVVRLPVDTALFYPFPANPHGGFGGHFSTVVPQTNDLTNVLVSDLCSFSTSIYGSGILPQYERINAMPNPFNTSTVLRYVAPAGGVQVTLEVRDALGRVVRTERLPGTTGNCTFNSGELPSGVYMATLYSDGTPQATIRLLIER
jgi:hypothetical protein